MADKLLDNYPMKILISTSLLFLILHMPLANSAVALFGGLTHEYEATGNQQIRGILKLQNLDKSTAELKIYMEDFALSGKNQNHPRSSLRWSRLGVSQVSLPGGGKQDIAYQIKVPPNARQGTYWSRILIEPVRRRVVSKPEPAEDGSFNVTVGSKVRYAVNVMVHIGGASKFLFNSPTVEVNKKGEKVLGVYVTNQGNRFGRPLLNLDVFGADGSTKLTLTGGGKGVLPGSRKRFQIPLDKLSVGQYKTLLSAEDEHSSRIFGTDLNLSILP